MEEIDIAQIMGLDPNTELPKQIRPQLNTIEHHEFDLDIYQDMYDVSEVMQEQVNHGTEILATFPYLSQDIFMALFKHTPKLHELKHMKKSVRLNHNLMGHLMESPDFNNLRPNTKLDIFNSCIASEVMQTEVLRKMEEMKKKQDGEQKTPGGLPAPGGGSQGGIFDQIKELYNQEQAQERAEQQAQALEDIIKEMQEQGQDISNLQQQLEQAKMTAEQAQEIAEKVADLLEKEMEKPQGQQLMQAISNAAQTANDVVDEANEMVRAWGLERGNDNNRVSYQDKKDALSRIRNSKKLKDFADLVGRMKEIAIDDQKNKSKDGAISIETVKQGNDINHTLPSEKMRLAHPTTKMDFLRRYHQKELLQYQLENTEKKNKGPIICCVDVSGSMRGTNTESPEKWAKAVTLALLEIAQKQRRNFACVLFDNDVNPKHVWEVPHGELKPNTVLDIAEIFPGGGTNFEKPLQRALKIMKSNAFKEGDIVFITDGDCGVSDSFLKEFNQTKEEKLFSVRSVVISKGGASSIGTVKLFSDEVLLLSSLLKEGEQIASDIFTKV